MTPETVILHPAMKHAMPFRWPATTMSRTLAEVCANTPKVMAHRWCKPLCANNVGALKEKSLAQ
jgi:hypothetical protein